AGVSVEWLSGKDSAGNKTDDWESTVPPSGNTAQAFGGIITKGGQYRSDNPALTVKFGKVTPTSVTDGLSNRLFVMEKAVWAQAYQPAGPGAGNNWNWDWWELPGWTHDADWPNMRLAGNWIPLLPDNQDRRNTSVSWEFNSNLGRP